MDRREFMKKITQLIDDHHSGILATVRSDGFPAMRHMTPTIIPGREGFVYALTSRAFPKVQELTRGALVSWLFTDWETSEVFSLRGKVDIIQDPRFQAEILEELGQRLEPFWRLDSQPEDVVCLETRVISGECFFIKTGEKIRFDFNGEQG